MLIRGKAWVFGRNVNTDLIFPKIWFRPTYEPGEMASHLMVGIDEAIFGTCTGGRIDDFRVAASIMKGRRLAPHTRMMVNPGSRETYLQAMHEGLIDIMVEAGATIGVPGCGPCSGCHQGMLAPAENAITNASRNFKGRFGSPEANAYVASSATVAASAIAGCIVSPAQASSSNY